MKLLIVGATGTLGRQIVRHAIDEGYQVSCLVRNPRKATFLKEWGANLVQGDLSKPETLKPALQGMDAIIDTATTRPTDAGSTRVVDWNGKVSLIQAAEGRSGEAVCVHLNYGCREISPRAADGYEGLHRKLSSRDSA